VENEFLGVSFIFQNVGNEEKSFLTLTSGIDVINFFSICNDPYKKARVILSGKTVSA
jgi:uroporphyrinogen-III synthase